MKNNIIKQIMSVVLSLSILSQPILANTSTNADKDREEFITYLEEQQESYKKHFDKEMLLEELDYDVEKIIDFVSNKIVYQAYDGVLRGVEGTLIGRAGNSHDQAITLASMLNDADVEAQIMVGELNDAQIEELNQQIASPIFESLPLLDKNELPRIMKEMVEEVETLKNVSEQKLHELYKENETIAQNIFNHIPKEALKKGKLAFLKELHDTTVSYRWVRYRKSANNPWINIHPTYENAKQWKLSYTSIEAGSINADALQKLSVEVWIETSEGKKQSVSGKWTAPSANLANSPLSIEIVSNAMFKPELLGKTKEYLDASNYFFIKINDALPKQGKVFDLSGNIYSGDSIEGLNSVFATVGKKLGEVENLFQNSLNFKESQKTTNKYLKKVWIEFTMTQPNTPMKNIIRTLYQRNNTSKIHLPSMKLLQRWDISSINNNAPDLYYQSQRIQQTLSIINGSEKFQQYIKDKSLKKEAILKASQILFPNPNITRITQIQSLFNTPFKSKINISYKNKINLLAIRQGFFKKDNDFKIYQLSDILSNQRVSFNVDNTNKLVFNPKLSIRHGVWETLSESTKLIQQKNIVYTDSAYNSLNKTNTFISTTSNNQMIKLHNNKTAWWSIDKYSGTTIGMLKLDQGVAGAEFAEYIGTAISISFTVVGTFACAYGTSADTACCLGANSTLLLGGVIAGLALGAFAIIGTTVGVVAGAGIDLASTKIDVQKACSEGGDLKNMMGNY